MRGRDRGSAAGLWEVCEDGAETGSWLYHIESPRQTYDMLIEVQT